VLLDGTPLKRMHFRSPQRVNKDTTYVFPRLPAGGVILGGCRVDNSWDGEVDLEFAEDIKRRCCALAPELGRPEDLKVIHHGVGLRREFLFGKTSMNHSNLDFSKQERWSTGRADNLRRICPHPQLWRGWCWISSVVVIHFFSYNLISRLT
jgi:hypothetical protein